MPRKFTKSNTIEFISKAQEIYGDTYDYSKVEYLDSRLKVEIVCYLHGPFFELPLYHTGVKRRGCARCRASELLKEKQNRFIHKATEIYSGLYSYSKAEYTGVDNKIIVTCSKHGDWTCTPHNHLRHGCPSCKSSRGELAVRNALINSNLEFVAQHSFPDCRYNNPLKFDFYIPDLTLVIEYDGRQHYEPVDFSGNLTLDEVVAQFESTKYRDQIKTNYCLQNSIDLLRVSYKDSDIEESVMNKIRSRVL